MNTPSDTHSAGRLPPAPNTPPQCKEVALIHSEGILAGEVKHGPLALVDEHLPIVVVATRDSMYAKMESVIQQLLARNARLVIVCTEGDEKMKKYVEGYDCQLIEVGGLLRRSSLLGFCTTNLAGYAHTAAATIGCSQLACLACI